MGDMLLSGLARMVQACSRAILPASSPRFSTPFVYRRCMLTRVLAFSCLPLFNSSPSPLPLVRGTRYILDGSTLLF